MYALSAFFVFRLCHITWLIFDGKILRNTSRFARLQTAGGMRPHKTLVLLLFFSSSAKINVAKINHSLWHSLFRLKDIFPLQRVGIGQKSCGAYQYFNFCQGIFIIFLIKIPDHLA